MKKIFLAITVLCSLVSAAAFSQSTISFDVDGIKVILKPTVKSLVSVRMFYRGGVTNYSVTQAGIENFALNATTECGTKKYTGNAFRDLVDQYGIQLGGESTFDYGDIAMGCTLKYFNEGWDLFAEAVVNPVFDKNEVELLRGKIIAQIDQQQSDPDEHIKQLLMTTAFANSPYATDPHGVDETIAKITADDLKAHYAKILNKRRMFLVVAGKISREEITKKIRESFGAIPSKSYVPYRYDTPIWNNYSVVTEKRELATSYMSSVMNAPQVTSPDYIPYRLGISALSGSIFSELRTNLNLSYDPGAYVEELKMPFAAMYVSTNSPKQAINAIVEQLNISKISQITPEGLKILKNGFITSNYISQQSSAAITSDLGVAEIMGGWQIAENLPEAVNKVTVEQIGNTFNKYIVGLRWAYLGNTDLVNDSPDTFKKQVK